MKNFTYSISFENKEYNVHAIIMTGDMEKEYHLFPQEESLVSRFGNELIIKEQKNKEWDWDVDAISDKMEFMKSLAWGLKAFQETI